MKTSLATNRSVQQVETLLSLSQDMATIRGRQDLLSVLLRQLKPMMGFEDAVISLYSPDYTTYKHFVTASPPERVAHPLYPSIIGQDLPVAGNPDEYVLAQLRYQSVLRWDTEEAEAAYPGHLTLQFLRENGLLHNVYLPLTWAGHLMGFMHFHFTTPTAILEENYPLYKAVADQVAVAVANILANEEILEREQEKSVLLAINRAIAGIRSRKELFAAIIEHVQTAMPVDDTGLLILDPTGRRWQDWTNVDNYQDTAGVARLQQLGYDQLLPVDRFMEYTLHHTGVMSLAAFREQYPEHPFGPVMWEAGLREFMYTPLVMGGRTLGVLFFDAEQEGAYTPKHLALFQAIADQVAVAVANILATEDILAREREKTTLLAISKQLATIRDKHDLFTVIFGQLQPVFRFDDAVVVLADEGLLTTRHLHTAAGEAQRQDAHYRAIMAEKVPVGGTPYQEFLFLEGPAIYSYHYLATHYPQHVGVNILKEFNLVESVFMPLRYGGRTLGTLEFHSKQQGHFSEAQLPLFRNVADQVAVAVANILANEEVLREQAQNAALLSLAESVATIHEREPLLRVVFERLQPIFGFYDVGLFVLSPDGQYLNDWATVHPTISPSFGNDAFNRLAWHSHPYTGTAYEQFVQRLAQAGGPQVVAYDKAFVALLDDAEQRAALAAVLREGGYREFMATILRTGGRMLGYLCFNSLEDGHFQPEHFNLFQAVANQLAAAVANIVATEDILAREREKELLLSLSEDMTTIRGRQDLWRVMMEKIKPLVGFDDAVLLILTEDLTEYSFVLTMSPTERQAHALYPRVVGNNQVANSPVPWYLEQPTDLFVQDLQALEADPTFPSDDPAVHMMKETGLWCSVVQKLRWSGRLMGLLAFHFGRLDQIQQAKYPLYKAIADQVAVAVANILATEDILAREREKTLLLQISEALAEARTRPELLQITLDQIRTVLPFADAGLFEVRPDGSHRDLTVDDQLDGMPTAAAISQASLSGFLPPHPAVAEFMQEPRIRSLAWLLEHCPGHPHFPYLLGAGLRELIGGPLVHNGRPLGMLCFWAREEGFFHPRQLPLFKQLLSLVGTTMATILAREEILARGQEKAQLLRISSALVTIQDRRQLFRVIYEDIRPIFPYESAGLFVVDPLGQTHYELTDEYILNSDDERRLEAAVGRGPFPHPGSIVAHIMQQPGPALYDLTELAATHPHPQLPTMLETGYRQLIAGPLMKGGEAFGMVCFNAKQPDFYSAQDLPLFQAIAEQLAVVVANILANEEILEREREKTQLLKVSEAISTIRDAKSLFSSLSDIIQSIIAFDEAPMIFLLDEQSQYYRIFYSKVFDPSANLSSLDAWQQGENLVATDAIATYLIEQNHALVLNLQQALEQWRDFPGKQTMLDLALKECLVAPLRVKDSLTGFLCVWSRKEGKFEIPKLNLFQAIADQVAVAIANILANEEILAREQEKTLLLSISEDIASVRGKKDLLNVVVQKIKPLFDFYDCGILILDKDRRYFYDLAVLHPQIDDSAVNHQLHRDGFYRLGGLPYPGSALEHFIQQLEGASGPVLVDYPSLPLHYSDAPLLASLVAGGYQQALAGLLRTGGEVFGCFMINARQANFFQPNQFPLFQNVVEQLSVAVANILANEELAGQAQEKALQVAVTEALHRGNTWETRFEALARTLQQFVPFDYAAIGLNSDPARGQVSGFRRVGSDEYQVLSMESLARVVNLPPEKFDSLRQAAVRAVVPGQPHLLAGPDFVAQNRQHPFKALLARTFKLATNLEVPVPLRQGHFLISLYSQHAATYSAAHLQLLGSLTGVFTDTVEKLLAYEEVNRLNERLAIEKDYLEEELKTNHNFEEIIGTGPQIQQAFRQVSQVAPTDATVLLLGETGTGKELFARALHNASPRKHKVLVKVNCAALPAQLIESELFGHEKGAFTGAVERRLGKFELADGGTLFLDEVGELPLELQPKLLRALQEKEIERVGGQKPIHVDVRVVAATNRDLAQEVAAGRFRQDLYYRLLVFPITLPALRERPDDIPLLARHFLHKFGKRFGRQVRSIAPAALQQMQAYDWPGNVRELEHLIEQSIILSETSTLELARPLVRTRHAAPISSAEPEFKSWQDAERDNILAVLRFTGGRIRGKGGAAELLDIKANTLDSRMQKLSIGKEYTVSAPAE